MKHAHATIIVLAIVVLAGVVLYENPGVLTSANLNGNGGQPTVAQPNQPSNNMAAVQDYTGALTVTDAVYNANDNSATLTDATNVLVTYYYKTSTGGYSPFTSSVSNTASVRVDPGVKTLYVGVSIPSGQNYFVAVNNILQKNPRLSAPTFIDPNNGGTKIWMFPFDVTGMGQYNRSTQTPSIELFIDAYASTTPTLNSPADQSSIGDGSKLNRIKWELDAAAATAAYPVSRIDVTFNDTDFTKWNPSLSYIEIPNGANVQRIYLSDMVPQQLSSTYQYEYLYSTDLSKTNFISIPKQGDTATLTPVVVYSNFQGAGQGLQVTLKVTYMTAGQAFASTSDTVKLLR